MDFFGCSHFAPVASGQWWPGRNEQVRGDVPVAGTREEEGLGAAFRDKALRTGRQRESCSCSCSTWKTLAVVRGKGVERRGSRMKEG